MTNASEIDLTGLHKITRRLASGKVKTYYYTKRGKGGKRIHAPFGSRAFMREFLELSAESDAQVAPNCFTVGDLIADYLSSRDFAALRPKTQEGYKASLKKINDKFGRVPLEVMDDKSARITIRRWRDEMADTPRAADMAHAVFKVLLSFGTSQGLLDRNILIYRLKPLRSTADSNRANKIWTPQDIAAFRDTAPEHLNRVMTLALATAQRKKDLLAMTWDAYDGETIRLTQSKTGAFVYIKATAELRDMLDHTPVTCKHILTTRSGRPWGAGFDSSWRTAVAKAGIEGLTFHDLRGTAVAIAMAAGATDQEIATMTGHSPAHLETLRARYMPSADVIRKIDAYHNRA